MITKISTKKKDTATYGDELNLVLKPLIDDDYICLFMILTIQCLVTIFTL